MAMKTTEIILPIVGLTSLILSSTASCQLLEFKGTFGDTVAPFQIDVKPDFIKKTTLKASLTRFTDDLQQPDFADGPPRHNATTIRDFWVNEFDWFQVQENLNKKYKQFTTTVSAGDIFTHPIPLHFVHHRSPRPNAIPLLFLHGWPGSFLEVGEIIDGLTNPPNTSTPAFHVVAPSMPGFGFSPAPSVPGLGPIALADAYNDLMVNKLNYSKYCLQGGDLGGFLLHEQAGRHPESVLSALSNFWVVQPNSTDLERFHAGLSTPDEEFVINKIMEFEHLGSGYRLIMQTKPLSLATGMTDSPVGLAIWIYSLMQEFVQFHVWTPLEIVTWTMMYWIQGPYSSFRYYKEHVTDHIFENGLAINTSSFPYVHQPVAISEFPADLWYRTPMDWAQRSGNVVKRTVHDRGSHFASIETPLVLMDDLRSFFGNETLSNTGAFNGGRL